MSGYGYSGRWSPFVRRAADRAQRLARQERAEGHRSGALEAARSESVDPEATAQEREVAFERWLDEINGEQREAVRRVESGEPILRDDSPEWP